MYDLKRKCTAFPSKCIPEYFFTKSFQPALLKLIMDNWETSQSQRISISQMGDRVFIQCHFYNCDTAEYLGPSERTSILVIWEITWYWVYE